MATFRGTPPLTEEWTNFDFRISEGVGRLTFDRPEKLNALTFEVYADLRDLLRELPLRDDVKVLVITGNGRGFCSGGDVHEIIGELLKMQARDLLDFTRMTGAVVQAMRDCPIPIIASVNGIAAGAGSVIALAADLRVMARGAKVAFLFTQVGLA
ncbi:MAG: enoyl-CoA hydratase/isomerase family protein, partial [Actinobacteria bacterium]|nr:enoyl-CoA hydratase/isomerase family protein [Actinomycetota bacterium]